MTTTPQRSTESVLPVVRYELECADPPWRVRSVRLDEVMGEPYRGTIEALCDEPDVDARQLVGRDVRLSIHRGEVERLVLGLVQQVEMLGSDEHHARVVLRFGPALSLLGRGPASRVFQRMTIPELLEALVGPTFTARARELDLEGLSQRSFEPRDYCVQYQESDLEFLHRLLDEEGLSYRFEHDRGEHEVLVITDADRGLRDLDAWAGGMDVPLVTDRPEEASMESVERVQRRQRPAGPSVVQRDWDWMARPAQVFEHAGPARPDAEVTVVNHGGRRLWSLDTTGIAARQQQAHAASEDVLSGCGNVVGFAAGTVYELLDSEHDGRYVVTRVEHRGDAPAVDLADGGPATARPSYDNRFECIPADVPYRRPVRSSKPRIHGPQTAVVVGPDNEEIFTDEHGRIKVRLHWDRSTTVDEDASCW
ncbi:MAG: type VI secretion system tip protein TssI/VgrG, partial [Nannocystaceae bacterium]